MSKTRKRDPFEQMESRIMLEAGDLLDRLAVGTWIPNVDICETPESVVVRVEVPGIVSEDIRITLQDGVLRVQGTKREPATARARISYYCLERRYGRFDRRVTLERVVDSSRARAFLADGILSIHLPKIEDRRNHMYEIPISAPPK